MVSLLESGYPPRLVLRRCGRAVMAAGPPAAILRAAFLLPRVSADSVAVFLVSAARMAAAKLIFGRGVESSMIVRTLKILVPLVRLEQTTYGLQNRCSTR